MSNTFTSLFGIDSASVKETCVIMPFDIPRVAEQLGVAKLCRGKLFSTGHGKGLTLIRSGMGAGFVGDSVLWLKDTLCRQVLFLGTCGLISRNGELGIGTVITPGGVLAFESFSDIITGNIKDPPRVETDTWLIKAAGVKVPICNCVSFASLHEESQYEELFAKLDAQVIEMECSAFFSAARKIGRRASALLVISDILGEIPFSVRLSAKEKKNLDEGISRACVIIRDFCCR